MVLWFDGAYRILIMFVDELTFQAKAGDGGPGVVRWLHLKFQPKAGPSGGNGGNGGSVYVRAVRDLNQLSKYTGSKSFVAADGEPGRSHSEWGHAGADVYIDLPVGSRITEHERGRVYELVSEGETHCILQGGRGGLGNEHFKSSTNRIPQESTTGSAGESGTFTVELALYADVGLIGLPNAGKSTLLNAFTNATSAIGAYAFTTLEPHLGSLFGYIIADIPGLIEGAHTGKGLGDKFLRHVTRTKMLLHLVSLENEDPLTAYKTIRNELTSFDKDLADKEEWIILTKKDLVNKGYIETVKSNIDKIGNRVFVIAENDPESVKNLRDELVKHLRKQETTAYHYRGAR